MSVVALFVIEKMKSKSKNNLNGPVYEGVNKMWYVHLIVTTEKDDLPGLTGRVLRSQVT